MVLSIKTAAPADYYWQLTGLEARPDLADCQWLFGSWVLGRRTLRHQSPIRPQPCSSRDTLDALLNRRTADDGRVARFNRKDGISGHDFVFSAPKSVSLVWAFSDLSQRKLIEEAHNSAVRSAAALIARYVVRERVGKGGQALFRANAAMAAFMHVLGRPAQHRLTPDEAFPDPNLHSHVVIPDLVVSRIARSKGGAPTVKIAYTTLYARWAMALGAWYHAALAHGLDAIGLPVKSSGENGLFQIEGIEPLWISAFSARSEGADRRAMLAGRKSARTSMTAAAIEACWKKHAANVGIGPANLFVHCSNLTRKRTPPKGLAFHCTKALSPILKSLAAKDAVLQLQDLFRGAASGFVERGLFVMPSISHVHQFRKLTDFREIEPSTSYRLPQFTTAQTKTIEQQVVDKAKVLSAMPAAQFFLASQLASNPTKLNSEQIAAATAIAREGKLSLLCGPPGTGKTTLLEPIVRAYQGQYGPESVIGASMAWMQAIQLSERFDIEPFSIASLLATKRTQRDRFDKVKLVIVDEAGLLPSKNMDDLLTFALRHRLKVILVGDVAQLDPIGAGSGLRLVMGAIAAHQLRIINRQKGARLKALTRELIALGEMPRPMGTIQPVEAVASSLAGKIVAQRVWQSKRNSEAAAQAIADRLYASLVSSSGQPPLRALMRSHRQAQHVTRLLRKKLRTWWKIGAVDLTMTARTPMGGRYLLKIAVGDHVRFLQRRPALNIYNGTEAEVIAFSGTGPSAQITVRLLPGTVSDHPPGATFTFAVSDIACSKTGHAMLSCAYATTIFGSQGSTYDKVVILKSLDMKFRELLVAVTRCRTSFEVIDVDWQKAKVAKKPAEVAKKISQELIAAKAKDRCAVLAGDFESPQTARPPAPWNWHVLCRDPVPPVPPLW